MELVQREFDVYGINIVSAVEALGALGEACTIIRRMWTETEPFDFDGRYYRLRGTICEPKPVQQPHPPILIGAGGEKVALPFPGRAEVRLRHGARWLSKGLDEG